MSFSLHLGYIYYVVFLAIATGIFVLLIDSETYRAANMKRERRAAKLLGWINISLGVLVLFLHWMFSPLLV
ncbi:hypothetical protein HN020_22455 [Brevibacillus borstelensis]|jgi:hypothetical protein|uniref:Uncharacterized protein n=1 Tax=Brevibacillus borstelensis AK1 TaxID=1300222 RepID=M8DCV4_9BACL|nr:CLC_0170 family protein [Brevibacillus borstelensis]EMT54129.1 hypothetical protein I532_00945 [Brevibacillus borstelensis AK1]KKX53956.1 hypothetical protein X546_16480 [Brevibacillus borstelensis cifa_chp40]MBE5397978.1 hypothetical protein [Brevibacillus borstelensis]MCC0563507.1 hypothetical protein [Brevibacillus borstelensis]MCM3469684.1 hypothetical protein [Brevibacillus borstelensis]